MLAPLRSRSWVAYGAAGIAMLLAWMARLLADDILKDQASFNFFFLAVAIAAWLGGIRPAIFIAVVSCLLGNYYFSHPYGTLQISGLDELTSLSMFLVVSVIIGVLGEVSLRAVERAQDAERAKDDFMATVAHELRSPLSVIHYANALDRISSDEQARDRIDLIDQQVQHLNIMVQDLLDVSRVARGKIRLDRQLVDASSIIDGAVMKAGPTLASRQHELSVAPCDEPLPILVDPMRMEQVLTNLLINAAKYTPDGGQISVGVDADGDSAVFTVRDNGIGIAQEMLPRVFDLFVQIDANGKNSDGGLGIGLALVKKLVEMHGGSVRVASDGLHRGSQFTISLPLKKHAPSPAALVEA